MKTIFTDTDDREVRERMHEAFPEVEPSDSLNRRVREMARQQDSANSSQQKAIAWPRFAARAAAFAGTAIVAVVGLTIGLQPRDVDAHALLLRVETAMDNLGSAHMVEWYQGTQDGKRHVKVEFWYRNGQWRREAYDPSGHKVFIGRDGAFWIYLYNSNPVTVQIVDQSRIGSHGVLPMGFTLSERIEDLRREGARVDERLLPNGQLAGHSLRRLDIVADSGAVIRHSIAWIDPKTDLIVRMEDNVDSEGHPEGSVSDYDYNKPVAASLLEPVLPKGAKVIDHRAKSRPSGAPRFKRQPLFWGRIGRARQPTKLISRRLLWPDSRCDPWICQTS